jgi:chitinase
MQALFTSRRRVGVTAVMTALALAVAAVAVVAAGARAAAPDLLTNGGFESGALSPWTCTSDSGAIVTSPVHSGSYALSATATGSDDAQCSQTVSVQPNSTYTLSGWVSGNYTYLGVTGSGDDTSNWTSGSSWSQLSTSFTTGASVTSVTVWVHGWYGQGTYYADDITLTGPGGGNPSPSLSGTSSSPSATPPTTSSATSSSSSPTTGGGGGGLPKHVLTGYWQDFDNGATDLKLSDVNGAYDIIAVAFAGSDSTPGEITFSLDPTLASRLGGYTDAQFKADIRAAHQAGKKVILSIGGANGSITVNDSASATNFANSAYSIIQNYGFDGVDVDLENGINAQYLGQGLHALAGKVGSGFVLTMAPQTLDMQSTGTAYFQLALAVKDILTIVNTQYYNSGSMDGCDGKVYSEGTVDFFTALACIQLKGGLAPSQVGLGVPASASAAGSGSVSPSVVDDALDCLASGTSCGSFVPDTRWPGIGGAMTWSINWDVADGNGIAVTVGGHLHAMP